MTNGWHPKHKTPNTQHQGRHTPPPKHKSLAWNKIRNKRTPHSTTRSIDTTTTPQQPNPKTHPTQHPSPTHYPFPLLRHPQQQHPRQTTKPTFEQVSALVLDPLRHGRQQRRGGVPHPPRGRPPGHELERVEARPNVEVRAVRKPRQGVRVDGQPLRRADGLR